MNIERKSGTGAALVFAVSVAVLGFLGHGCAYTNYTLITDNDQVHQGGSGVVNTQGQAHFGKAFAAAIWPDGTDQLIHFVDQKANGDRTLTTYNNFSTGDDPVLYDRLYCNPDWQGCAIFTADDPEIGDLDPFDGRFNENCNGARSLMLLYTDSYRFPGECGRSRLTVDERIALMNMGRRGQVFGREGLFYDLDGRNTVITLDNLAGFTETLEVPGSATLFTRYTRDGVRIDLTNPLLGSLLRSYADFLEQHATNQTRVTINFNGIARSWDIAGNRGPSTPERVRALANARY